MSVARKSEKFALLTIAILSAQIVQVAPIELFSWIGLDTMSIADAATEMPASFKPRYMSLLYNHKNVYSEDEIQFLCDCGEWLIAHHEIGQARLLYERLRKSNRVTPYVLCGLAATYMDEMDETVDAATATKFLNQALAIDNQCSRAYCRLAEISLLQDRLEESLSLADKALKCPVVFGNAYLVKARAQTMLKRYEQAYKSVLDAEKYYGRYASVFNTKGGILEQLGRNQEAADAFRSGFKSHPSDWTQHQIINCLLKAGKDEEALKETARLISIAPGDADVYRLRASIYKKLKNYPAALKDLDRTIDMEPSSVAYKERADVYNKLGKPDKSKADLAAARKILE